MKILEHLVQSPLATALGWALLHFLWQGALIALLLAAAFICLPSRWSRLRYALACAALGLMPVIFAVTVWGSLPAVRPPALAAATHFSLTPLLPLATGTGHSPLARWPQSWTAIAPWVAPCWMFGALLLWARAGAGCLLGQRLRRTGLCAATPEWQERLETIRRRLRLSRPARLMESCLTEVPVVIGFLRPLILMPIGLLSGLPSGHVEAFLVHELAYIRRCDYLVNLVQTFVEGLLFYHPAVWWVSRIVREERETCCDDTVVAFTGDAPGYAAALTKLEERRWLAAEATLSAKGGSLMKRIRRLLGHDRPHAGAAPLIALLLVPVCVSLAAWKTAPPKSAALQVAAGPIQTQPQVAPPDSSAPKPVASAQAPQPMKRPESKSDRHQSSNELRDSRAQAANSRELEDLNRAVEQIRQKAVPTVEMTRAVEQLRGLVAQLQVQRPQAPPVSPYQVWLEQDVAYIITPQEKAEFQSLQTDQQRQDFIERFWQKRDPTPGTPRNEFQEEHYRRIAYANDHFGFDGTEGWRTDRGRIYIWFGPPDAREVFEKGRSDSQGKTTAPPFEQWRYRAIQGVGDNVTMEFIDRDRTGNYQMTKDPAGPDGGQRFVPPPTPQ